MSSLKKASKSQQRIHKERHQPAYRSHLGLLEKKKDYKLRASHYEKNKNTLKALRKKALNKNPDEFYFHMINSELKDGIHHEKRKEDNYTDEQLKLMETQDLNYVVFKKSVEDKKIEKLKSTLHFLDVEDLPKNKHTFFVDSKKSARNFDIASHLNTVPELLERKYNRPRNDTLKQKLAVNEDDLYEIAKEKQKRYCELSKRVQRYQQLNLVGQTLEVKKMLLNKKEMPIKQIQAGDKNAPPVYLWKKERKK